MSDFSNTSINHTTIQTSSQLLKIARSTVSEGIIDSIFNAQNVADYLKDNNFRNPDGTVLTCEQVDSVFYNHSLGENSCDHPSTDLMVTNPYLDEKPYDYAFRNFGWVEKPNKNLEIANRKSVDAENESHDHNCETLIDIAANLYLDMKLPNRFTAGDLVDALDSADYVQDNGAPFTSSYIDSVLSSYLTDPSKLGDRKFYVDLHPESELQSYKYVFVGSDRNDSLGMNLVEYVYNGMFQGLLADEFTEEEAYNFLMEVGEINSGEYSPAVIGIYLRLAVQKVPSRTKNGAMLKIHESCAGTTFSLVPVDAPTTFNDPKNVGGVA